MNFIAIDVETANSNWASICAIGLVKVTNGKVSEEWVTYVDPKSHFVSKNVAIHKINESTVRGSPSFFEIHERLCSYLEGNVVVSHGPFDRVAIHQAAVFHSVTEPDATWLDSTRVARRAWKQCADKGYGLEDVCAMLGHDFQHHDPLEDAKAAAHVVLSACRETGLDIEGWFAKLSRSTRRSGSKWPDSVAKEGNPEGRLFGEVLVFTGALETPRRDAADLAASVGCAVAKNVTKKTTMLVVGDQDLSLLAGHKRSSKQRRAEELVQKGQKIRILGETDFKNLVNLSEDV